MSLYSSLSNHCISIRSQTKKQIMIKTTLWEYSLRLWLKYEYSWRLNDRRCSPITNIMSSRRNKLYRELNDFEMDIRNTVDTLITFLSILMSYSLCKVSALVRCTISPWNWITPYCSVTNVWKLFSDEEDNFNGTREFRV